MEKSVQPEFGRRGDAATGKSDPSKNDYLWAADGSRRQHWKKLNKRSLVHYNALKHVQNVLELLHASASDLLLYFRAIQLSLLEFRIFKSAFPLPRRYSRCNLYPRHDNLLLFCLQDWIRWSCDRVPRNYKQLHENVVSNRLVRLFPLRPDCSYGSQRYERVS